jgi:D-galactarolactone isomerase
MQDTPNPGRRAMLAGAGSVLGLAGAAAFAPAARAAQGVATAVKFSTGSAPPRTVAPDGATDCHHHVYDARFPPDPRTALRPPDASAEDYRALQRRLGLSRSVLVQPSTYGTDNRLHLQAMQELGPQRARMVAVVDTSVTDEELQRLHGLGVRGIRFNLVQTGATTPDMLEPLSRRVHALGWHCQVHMLGDQIAEAAAMFERLPSRIVFDHLGRIPMERGVDHPAYGVIRRLMDRGNTWVKLSGAYMDSKAGEAGNYADTVPVARGYAQGAPERCVWASDWPHVTQGERKADDAQLFDLLAQWVPDERARTRILVDNPTELYDFPRG